VEEIYEDEVNAVVIHGDEIDDLQGWQWDQSTDCLLCAERCPDPADLVFSKDEIVFARTSPKHKLEIGASSFMPPVLPSDECCCYVSEARAGTWAHCWSVGPLFLRFEAS
jgi:hypothetical protein